MLFREIASFGFIIIIINNNNNYIYRQVLPFKNVYFVILHNSMALLLIYFCANCANLVADLLAGTRMPFITADQSEYD